MANKTGKNVTFKLDDSAGALAALTSHLNSASIAAVQSVLQDTALGDGEHTYVYGVAGATIPLAGFWNSTTEALFGPLMGNDTSKTKTWEWYDSISYKNGECLVSDVEVSGEVDTVLTFSANATLTGAMNRTSKALA